jgi:hypothetical protein
MKLKFLFMFVIFLVFVVSCTPGTREPGTQEDFFRGSEGIRMRFIDNMPPPTIYVTQGDENTFPILIEAHNVGAITTVSNFYISGFDPTMIKIEGIDPGRPSVADCDFTIDYFQDFNRIGADCNWGNVFLGNLGQGSDWWSSVNFNNLDFFEDLCDSLTNEGSGCSWLGDLDLNIEYVNGEVSWQAANDNLAFISNSYEKGARFMIKGAIIIGSFADPLAKTKVINGNNNNYYGGERVNIDFSGWVENMPEGMTDYNPNLQVTSCYLYATVATPSVCVDPNPYSNQRKACVPVRSQSVGGGQGAPVAITRIEQETTPRKIFFNIFIENVGPGTIYDYYNINKCSPYYDKLISPLDLNTVYIEDIRLSGVQLKCTPGREVRLVNGRGQVMCEFDMDWTDQASAYETPLFVELGYAYRQEIQKRISIKKI